MQHVAGGFYCQERGNVSHQRTVCQEVAAGMAGLIDLAFGMVEGGEGALKYSVTNEGYRKEAR